MVDRTWFYDFVRDDVACCAEYRDYDDYPAVVAVWTEPDGVSLALSEGDFDKLEWEIAESRGFAERYDGDDQVCAEAEREAAS